MKKNIVLAIDSFKGSASSLEVSTYIEKGIKEILPEVECVKIPIADGGEGTVEAIVTARQGVYREVPVLDPLGKAITAFYGLLPDGTAVIEMSSASGITLLKREELNPLKTSTYGTGQLILDALNHGAKDIFIGIGGSATNDGGMGMAVALGAKFLDKEGQELAPSGETTGKVSSIDMSQLDPRIAEANITILCDVDNPLCGPRGASHIFGAQKGADAAMKYQLDDNLLNYSQVIKEYLGMDVAHIPGAGAAGGLGAGLLAFTGAHIRKGIEVVLSLVQLEEYIKAADLVITGEGRMDRQTAFGKAPVGISAIAKQYDIPVIAVVGSVDLDADEVYDKGISLVIDLITQPLELSDAIKNVDIYATHAGKTVGRLIKNFM